ncbi:MAG TPA: 8-oxo-dGTP diphosphatase MutT [Methylomirabilota bacterium]|nr:8-oxo-dGTP diphosphatase MutT [Methylomirabilota bacterium]
MTTIEVAAGLVFRAGRLLITQRPAGGHLAGLWEFPGGKREPGESFEECLRRELLEEVGIEVDMLETVESISHDYPEKRVRLEFLRCRWRAGEPRPLGCAAVAWVGPADLTRYEFPAADARLLRRLTETPAWWE